MIGTPQERQAAAQSLAKSKGSYWGFASEDLKSCEIDHLIKQKQMTESLQARNFAPQPVMLDASNTTGDLPKSGEPVGDPREGLASAKADLAMAEIERDEAGEVVDRALQRLAKAEADVAEHDGLSERIDAWHIAETRGGQVGDMPYQLIAGSRERAAATDRLEHATRAHRVLACELRDVERKVQQLKAECSIWASRVLQLEEVEKLAADVEHLTAELDEKRARLDAFHTCNFPAAGGLPPITATVHRALNLCSRPRAEHGPLLLGPHRQRWLAMHAELLADHDAAQDSEGCAARSPD